MTYFVQLVQIQKETKLCNKARVLISKEKVLYLHPKIIFLSFCFRFDNNCFMIRSQSLFLMNIFGKRSDLPFFRARMIVRRRKAWFRLRVSRISTICSQTQLYDISHKQTIICRHLLAGQVPGEGGGGTPYMKGVGMLVVSPRGANFEFFGFLWLIFSTTATLETFPVLCERTYCRG